MFSVAFLDKYIYVVGEVCCVEKGEKKDIGMFMSFYQWRDFELLSFVDEKVLSNDLIKSTKKEKKVQTKLYKINSLFKIGFKDSNQSYFALNTTSQSCLQYFIWLYSNKDSAFWHHEKINLSQFFV